MIEWFRYGIAVECPSFSRKARHFVTFGDTDSRNQILETGNWKVFAAAVLYVLWGEMKWCVCKEASIYYDAGLARPGDPVFGPGSEDF